jgi:hypothetical protein
LPPTDPRYSRPSPETRRFQVKWVVSHAQATGITTERVPFPRVPFSVHLVGRGFRHHINQQPTASRARFPDRSCLPPIPDIPVRAPKPGGSRLNGSFHTPKPPEPRHSVFLFRGSPFPSLSWRGGSDTTLTSNQLLPGLVFPTDHASHRSPIFPSEPRNQEVPG